MQNSLGIQPAEDCGGRRGRCRRETGEGPRERPPAGDRVSGSSELTGGGRSSPHLLPPASSPCTASTLLFPHRAPQRRAAHQVRPASRLSRVGGGRGGTERGLGGPVEERGAQVSLAAARAAQAWVLHAGGSERPLRSHFQLVRPFPGLLAPPRRLPPSSRPRGCTPAAGSPRGWFCGPGSGKARSLRTGAWNRRR